MCVNLVRSRFFSYSVVFSFFLQALVYFSVRTDELFHLNLFFSRFAPVSRHKRAHTNNFRSSFVNRFEIFWVKSFLFLMAVLVCDGLDEVSWVEASYLCLPVYQSKMCSDVCFINFLSIAFVLYTFHQQQASVKQCRSYLIFYFPPFFRSRCVGINQIKKKSLNNLFGAGFQQSPPSTLVKMRTLWPCVYGNRFFVYTYLWLRLSVIFLNWHHHHSIF